MSTSNCAAWLDGKGQKLRVGPADTVKPGKGEVLIKVHATAINPIDPKQQSLGLFINKFPYILGHDAAGEIIEVGEDVSNLSAGQRVVAHTEGMTTGRIESSSFQNLVVAEVLTVCPLPDNISYEQACVLPLAISTAAAGLYQSTHLALPLPSTSPKRTGRTLLVWGGSSSVGSAAIRLATASGVDVIATASPKNFDFCKTLGAKEVFEYNSTEIVDDLVAALQNTQCAGAYDAIGSPEAQENTIQVLAQLGGGTVATVNSQTEKVSGTVILKKLHGGLFLTQDKKSAKAVWQDFLPTALSTGQMKPAPEPLVIGTGLKFLQEGLDVQKRGVSAKKIVVAL